MKIFNTDHVQGLLLIEFTVIFQPLQASREFPHKVNQIVIRMNSIPTQLTSPFRPVTEIPGLSRCKVKGQITRTCSDIVQGIPLQVRLGQGHTVRGIYPLGLGRDCQGYIIPSVMFALSMSCALQETLSQDMVTLRRLDNIISRSNKEYCMKFTA